MGNPQLGDSQKVPYNYILTDAKGAVIPLGVGETFTVVSSDIASLTVVPDATPAPGTTASGFLVGGAKVQTGVTATAQSRKADGVTPIEPDIIDTLDIVAGAAVTAAFTLGTPVAQ